MLANGEMVNKTSLRVFAMGDVDELNASLGVCLATINDQQNKPEWTRWLQQIQNELFDLGADLAIPLDTPTSEDRPHLRIVETQVTNLECWIDQLNETLQPLTSFILPGGSAVAAQLHLSRTVCRRAERLLWQVHETEILNEHSLKYLNRLSDLLFVLARVANNNGQTDVLWKPGASR